MSAGKKRIQVIAWILIALSAVTWLVCYYIADTPLNAERRVRQFLSADARDHPRNPSDYGFHAYRIGERAWGVSYGMRNVPVRGETCFVDRHHRVFRSESKALSELLKEELNPRRGDDAFIKRFLLLLNGESFTVLETLPETALPKLALDPGEKIRPPEWLGNHTYRFYAHQKIGGVVYRCVFHYGEDGFFQTAEVVRLGNRVEPCLFYS